ncbi:MAG: hypothetical protein HPY44_00525 [Armatimonadetes bacterium]|nr:hypothetical protein [Armatimonadota bacterium]
MLRSGRDHHTPLTRAVSLAIATTALLVASSLAECQELDFEQPGAGWSVAQGAARWSADRPARGTNCLVLDGGTEATWVVSEELGVVVGEPFELSLALRPTSGEPIVALALVKDAGAPEGPYLWRGKASSAPRWSRRSFTVVCGIAGARLAIGVEAGSGSLAVDDVRLGKARLAPVTRKIPKDRLPDYGAQLPPDWQPQGKLDLQVRTFMGEESTYIQAGMLELNPLQEVTIRRGERTGMYLDVFNRAPKAGTLRVEVQGPRGWRMETWETEVPGLQTVSLNLPLQSMTAGDCRVKVVFGAGDSARSMPVTVHTLRQYPVLGAFWTDPDSIHAKADALPVQFNHLIAPPDLAQAGLLRLGSLPGDAGLTLDGTAAQALAALRVLPEALAETLATIGLTDPALILDTAKDYYAAARAVNESAVITGRPFALRASATGLEAGEDLRSALVEGSGRWADVLSVRLPEFAGSVAVRETGETTGEGASLPCLEHFDRSWDLAGLRNELIRAGATLPLFALVSGHSTGADGLDAVLLSRIITQIAAVGANGIALPGMARSTGEIGLMKPDGTLNEAVVTVVDELARELAGAIPLSPPMSSAVAAYEPGRPVVLRSFIRGDEGIVVLWNNTRERQSVAVDVRARPVQVRLLRISYPGELCQREFDGSFTWDALARRWGLPAVFVDVEPLQTVVVSLKLRNPDNTWLREVGPQPPKDEKPAPDSLKAIEEHGWRDL